MSAGRLLIIEDEAVIGMDLMNSLEHIGHEVLAVIPSGQEAIDFVDRQPVDLILMDINLNGPMRGTEAARIIYEKHHTPVVFLTAHANPETLAEAEKAYPYGYILKPFRQKELAVTIRFALNRSRAEHSATSDTPPVTTEDPIASGRLIGHPHQVVEEPLESWLGRLCADARSETAQALKEGESISRLLPSAQDPGLWIDFTAFAYQPGATQKVTPDGKAIQSPNVVAVFREISSQDTVSAQLPDWTLNLSSETAESVLITNTSGQILSVNPCFTEKFGLSTAEALGNSYEEILGLKRHGDGGREQACKAGEDHWQARGSVTAAPSQELEIVERGYVVYGLSGQIEYLVIVLQELESLKNFSGMLNYMAFHDELTGLGNRFLMDDHLALEINRASRRKSSLAMLYIDLDDFKPVNDQYGHQAGDEVLRTLGRRFRENLRDIDTCVRVGGDEFIIIAPDINGSEGALLLARRVMGWLTEPVPVMETRLQVACSIGIAMYPENARSAQTLINAADAAMYKAKGAGKMRITLSERQPPPDHRHAVA